MSEPAERWGRAGDLTHWARGREGRLFPKAGLLKWAIQPPSGWAKQQIMTDQSIQQAIDACRPGGDDLLLPEVDFLAEAVRTDPEVRRTYERSQQFDAAVGLAFRDVPVPSGLAERLLSAVETSAVSSLVAQADCSARVSDPADMADQRSPEDQETCRSPGGSVGKPATAPLLPGGFERPCPPLSARDSGSHLGLRRRWTRGIRPRTWAVMATTLAATAALVGFLLVSPLSKSLEPVVDEHLPGEVLAWREAVTRQGWNDNLLAAELHERPLDRAVRVMPRRWCQIQTSYDARTMVYDLAPPGEEAALVFCIRSEARNSALPDTPWNASSATGGLTLGVWRRGDIVYVLMVQGGPRRYREFIESSPLIGFDSRIGSPASLTGKA